MKIYIIIFSLLFMNCISGCSQKSLVSTKNIDEDYVLVEFASKLEEDFHRINNIPTEINENNKGQHP